MRRFGDEGDSLSVGYEMSSKKLYERLVGIMLTRWAYLYPVSEWRDPESAFEKMAHELVRLRELAGLPAIEHVDSRGCFPACGDGGLTSPIGEVGTIACGQAAL